MNYRECGSRAEIARPLHIEYSAAAYHVAARGNARPEIFRDESAYQRLLQQLRLDQEGHVLVIHMYVLMRNHYHFRLLHNPLLLAEQKLSPSRGVKRLKPGDWD